MTEKLHILVADDASFTRDLLKKGIRGTYPGFALHEVANGRQAMNKLDGGGFDLVLCDWEMPEVSGLEVLEWLRQQEHLAELPFIMVTSRGDREHVVEAVEKGASNYLVKPFTNEKLIEVVTKALARSRGVSAKALKRLGAAEAQPSTNDSASVLAGGLSGDLGIAESIQTRGEAATAPAKTRAVPRRKVIAQMRYSAGTIGCLVKEVDFQQAVGIIKRPEQLPALFEAATFDFTTEDDQRTSRMNAYVHALQAAEKRREAEFVRVTLRFVDDDPEKQSHLGHFFQAIDE